MRLITMTDFVLAERDSRKAEVEKDNDAYWDETLIDGHPHYIRMIKYAEFLKTPLSLGMFVPCDLEGNPLSIGRFEDHEAAHRYLEAKNRVLFKHSLKAKVVDGICELKEEDVAGNQFFWKEATVERLIDIFNDIELTKTAIKQIFG